jgi:tetratricopeptide (TPR) repeat protein
MSLSVRLCASALVMTSVVMTATLSGCSLGQGKQNAAHASNAKKKMNSMKAATEWQTARGAFFAGDLDKALKHIDISLTQNNEVVKSHVLRGRIMLEMGNIEQAVVSFTRAGEMDPKAIEPKYFMGLLNERIAQKDKALDYYRQAAELDPTNAQYAVAAAEMMIDLGQMDQAKQYLESMTAAFEHNAGVRQTLGHIAMIQKDYPAAATYFNEARMLAPDDPTILEDVARASAAAGNFADAEYALAKLLSGESRKERRDLLVLRAQVLTKIDRLVDARSILIDLTHDSAGASDVEAWIAMGNVCYLLNDQTHLKQAVQRTVSLAPNRAEGYVLRGLLARKSQDFLAAQSNFKQATAIQPNAETYVLLGLTQLDLENAEEAKLSFKTALSIDPNSAEANELLSQFTAD